MTSLPLVTVVVTPRERFSVARRTFETIAANTPGNYRFVFVAGGAPADFQRFLQDACAKHGYQLILRPDFLAPNVARNIGLACAETKYVAFLDNDVVVEPGWLDALVRCAEEEDADIVGPLCLMGEPSDLNLHSYGGKFIIEEQNGQLQLRELHHFGQINLRDSPKHLTRVPTDYAEFHCSFVRRSVFERIGPLDESIIGGAEHVDLALHMRELGCRGFTEPTAVVSHLAIGYTLGDLDSYTRRWNTEWYVPSMTHLAKKWRFVPNADLLNDYLSDFLEKRERCLLRLDTLRSAPPISAANLRVEDTIVALLGRMEALGYDPASVTKVREAHAVAAQLFAANHRASGRPLLAHLAGMASILAVYGANPTVIAAALFGEAYAQGQFPKGFDRNVAAMRRWLQRRVGDRVEKLAFTYSCLRPASVTRYLPDDLDGMPIGLANTVIMKIADEIENRHAVDHRLFDSSAWLQDSSETLVRWMPAFIAAASCTGFGEMLNVLQELAARTPPDTIAAAVRPGAPLNFILDSTSGGNRPLSFRNVVEADGCAPAVAAGSNRCAIKLGAIAAVNGGSVGRAGDCTVIETAQRAWTYSAEVRLPRHIRQTGPAVIEIRLQADQGEIGAMVLERGSSVFALVPEQSVAAGPEPSTLHFDIAAIEEAGQLVFRGWPHDDGAAKARIFEISLVSGAPARSSGRRIRDWLAALIARLRLS